jgi:cytosine/adenosine deaminase-related metal-dependent hydrolase
LKDKYGGAEAIGSNHHAVLPGLINAHHHSNGVPNSLQGVDDDFLELWLFANIALRSQDPMLKTLLSAAALLQSGVTSVVDVATLSDSREAGLANAKGRLQAYDQAGLRVALTLGVTYTSFLVHGSGEDEAFLSSLPEGLRQQLQALVPLKQTLSPEDYLDLISDLVRSYQTHPHIDIWFGPPGPQWVSDDLLVQIADAAERLNTGVQTHAVESFYEKLAGPRCYGKSVVAHLHQLGVLSPRFSIAHGVWLSEEDIQIMAATGAAVSHNPSSNLRLRAGVAPLNQLIAAGVTVGLGMDGTALADDEDMFAEMRLAARLHRTPQLNEPAPSLTDVFQMATVGGAKLLMQPKLGKIAPGYKADLVLVNCDRLTWPWIAPEANPLHVVMMRARAVDVDTVLVNGKVVLQNGQPTGFDLPAVGQEIAAQLNAAPDRAAYFALAKELRPHLARWYGNWQVPTLSPYATFNSRI